MNFSIPTIRGFHPMRFSSNVGLCPSLDVWALTVWSNVVFKCCSFYLVAKLMYCCVLQIEEMYTKCHAAIRKDPSPAAKAAPKEYKTKKRCVTIPTSIFIIVSLLLSLRLRNSLEHLRDRKFQNIFYCKPHCILWAVMNFSIPTIRGFHPMRFSSNVGPWPSLDVWAHILNSVLY